LLIFCWCKEATFFRVNLFDQPGGAIFQARKMLGNIDDRSGTVSEFDSGVHE
jgi:hypothetical protein